MTWILIFCFIIFLASLHVYIKESVEGQLNEFRMMISRRSINTDAKLKKMEEKLAQNAKYESLLPRL
jgi:hypothetical protein